MKRKREDFIDFQKLAEKYPNLQRYVYRDRRGNSAIHFQDAEANRQLTMAILCVQHQLTVEIPRDKLCPAVPSRVKYLRWVHDIIAPTTSDTSSSIWGLDIGVGGSCIYPLLGCRLFPEWNFIGTDIQQESVKEAQENVDRNPEIQSRIKLLLNPDPQQLFPEEIFSHADSIAFTVCNPPFYESETHIEESKRLKSTPSTSVCTGNTQEMITIGGEWEFLQRMLEQSRTLDRVHLITTWIGIKKDYDRMLEKLQKLVQEGSLHEYHHTVFQQGRTRRWGLAWRWRVSK